MEQTLFECRHCEDFGESSFTSYQNLLRNSTPKVWIKNLPEGLTEIGVENIALCVGKPLRIVYNPKRHIASIEFKSWREVELAVQHLDSVPPYYLKVEYDRKKKEPYCCVQEKLSTPDWHMVEKGKTSSIDTSGQESPTVKEVNEKDSEEVFNRIILKSYNYDPSLRMRQTNLDFESKTSSVSYGRGFVYLGNTDRFVGGLQKFECSSENGTAKNQMKYYCENCQALTVKCCKNCSASYCSKACLNSTENNHIKNCNSSDKEFKHSEMVRTSSFSSSSSNSLLQVPLSLGCTVVIATYLSMKTVFVRRYDQFWEEKFSRLINDVALAALKGEKLTHPLKEGDLVIAKYYKDLCYYRARVCSDAVGEQIQLFFIDFGNTQETNVKDLKLLPNHLRLEPAFAVKVHLKDIPNESSINSVNYFNKLTAESVPLILKFHESTDEVVLIEKDSNENVNKTVLEHLQPSWKKNKAVLLKSGEVYYLSAIKQQPLEEGKTYDLLLSHFNEQEFFDSEVFWVTNTSTDEFYHANTQMQENINEYCELLKDDCYMPRDRELCLAKEKGVKGYGRWCRCCNLKSTKTTCCLFFLDDGHSSLFETKDIRKMIGDFTETPAQAICCILPDNPNLKTNKELQAKAVKFLKESVGRTISSVRVLKKMGDAYCLSVPEINKLFA